LCFALKTSENLRIAGDVIGKKLERDETMEATVFGFIDNAHAAAAEYFGDAVVGERLSHQGRSVCHVGRYLSSSGKKAIALRIRVAEWRRVASTVAARPSL
jgi:hypothetical protein